MSKDSHFARAVRYAKGVLIHADPSHTEAVGVARAWSDGYEAARRDLRKVLKKPRFFRDGLVHAQMRLADVEEFLKPRR